MRTKVHVWLPPEDYQRVYDRAQAEGKNVSQVVREAIAALDKGRELEAGLAG